MASCFTKFGSMHAKAPYYSVPSCSNHTNTKEMNNCKTFSSMPQTHNLGDFSHADDKCKMEKKMFLIIAGKIDCK